MTTDQLIALWLLYNKVPWAVVIETINCDHREVIDEFFERVGINSTQVTDKEADGNVLIVTGPEAVLRQLVLETEVLAEEATANLYVDLWHGGRAVFSNWR